MAKKGEYRGSTTKFSKVDRVWPSRVNMEGVQLSSVKWTEYGQVG